MRGRLREKDLVREGRDEKARENGVSKWSGLSLTIGLNQQHLRMFAEGVNQIEQ